MAKSIAGLSILAFSIILPRTHSCFAQAAPRDANSQIAGVWRGESVCTVKDSPCHDEVNIYRFSEVLGRPGEFNVTGSKIVDGKEIAMGTSEWKYDAEKHMLEADMPSGSFRFTVDGSRMEGTLSLSDNTPYRRIHLTKETVIQPK